MPKLGIKNEIYFALKLINCNKAGILRDVKVIWIIMKNVESMPQESELDGWPW